MKMTVQQSSELKALLQALPIPDGSLDLLLQLIDQHTTGEPPAAGDPYANIRSYSSLLYDKFRAMGTGIVSEEPDDEMLAVYMEKDKVRKLLHDVPEDGYLAAFPGIHTPAGKSPRLTISLLATDKSKRPLEMHISGGRHGEQCWDSRTTMKEIETALPAAAH